MKWFKQIKLFLNAIILLIVGLNGAVVGMEPATPSTKPYSASNQTFANYQPSFEAVFTFQFSSDLTSASLLENPTGIIVTFADQIHRYSTSFEGKEYAQLMERSLQEFPSMSPEAAIENYLADVFQRAKTGDVEGLLCLLSPSATTEQLDLQTNTSSLSSEINTRSLEKTVEKAQQGFKAAFEKSAKMRATENLQNHLSELSIIQSLRSDASSKARLLVGLNRYANAAQKFIEFPTPKNLFEFISTDLYGGNPSNVCEIEAEKSFDALKMLVINEHICVNRSSEVSMYSPSRNKKEIILYKLGYYLQRYAPEVYKNFYNKCRHLPEFSVLESGSLGFINSVLYAVNTSVSSDILNNSHFKHLGTLDVLCKNGKINEAQSIVHLDKPIEKDLIQEYTQLQKINLVGSGTDARPVDVFPSQQTASHLSTILFSLNNHAESILEAYSPGLTAEMVQFKATSWDQYVNHTYIVNVINSQADRVFSSYSITEQALAMYVIDGFIKAYDLNKDNNITSVNALLDLSHLSSEFVEIGTTFITNFLSRLGHNAAHPIEYITERVVSIADLGYFIADATLGQLFRTPEQRLRYFNQLDKKIEAATLTLISMSANDLAGAVANILADCVFDGGIASLAQCAKQQLPGALSKLSKKIEKAAEGMHEREVVTPEGMRFSTDPESKLSILKSEMSHSGGSTKSQGSRSDIINQSSTAVLKNGYYEVNGFKFSEYYYNRLWSKGRGAPSLIAKEILENSKKYILDRKPGFYRYEHGGWELVYNPITKEIWHLQPLKK